MGGVLTMQVSVEKLNNVERKLTIVVPANKVEDEFNKQITEFAQKANIKGFRPGKVPVSHIKQNYGEDLRKEATGKVIQQALYEALMQEKLQPVSTPEVEPKSILADQPLEFTAKFEVIPEIEKVEFKLDDLEKLDVEIKDEDVTRVIDQLRKQYTKWTVVERAAKADDRVVIDYYATFEGKDDKDNKVENFPLELGSKVMLPGFEDGLHGCKPGDEKTLSLSFPEDFADKEKAGKPIEFTVTVKQVFEAEMPELNKDFATKLGIKDGSVEELTSQIRKSLESERDRLVKEKLKEQIFTQLLEQNAVEVPKALIEREAKNILEEIYQQQPQANRNISDEEMNSYNEVAQKRVSLGLLISQFAKQAELKPDAKRVDERIKEIAAAYENPQEVLEYLSSPERRGGIESQVMEDQVLEKLMEGTEPTVKTMTYAELKGIRI